MESLVPAGTRRWLPVAAVLGLSGCLLTTAPYRPTRYLDLAPATPSPSHQFEIRAVRTQSPFDTRVVRRTGPTEVTPEEYTRWSDAPGALVGRYLRTRYPLSSHGVPPLSLSAQVFVFEFDTDHAQARFGIECTVEDTASSRLLLQIRHVFSAPLDASGKVGSLGEAMTEAVARFCEELEQKLPPAVERGADAPVRGEGP
jgi:hypothetical protein